MNPILCRAALALALQHVHPAPEPSTSPAPAPTGTLAQDTLDRPAATSVRETTHAGMTHEMDHAPYVHRDADLVPDEQASGHDTQASAPAADPHAGHHMPDHP